MCTNKSELICQLNILSQLAVSLSSLLVVCYVMNTRDFQLSHYRRKDSALLLDELSLLSGAQPNIHQVPKTFSHLQSVKISLDKKIILLLYVLVLWDNFPLPLC